jgi:hypothetical protein
MKTLSKVIIALSAGSLFAGCGYLTPAPEEPSKSVNVLSKCEQNALIDNFDDADDQINVVEGRGQYIYTYADALGTTIEYPQGESFRAYPGGVGQSTYLARFRGHTATSGGDIFAGIGFGLSEAESTPYDASKYTGVSFIAKRGSSDSVAVVRFNIADVNTDEEGHICTECYNHFGTPIKLADQWTRYVIFFDELEQRAGWGDPRPDSIDKSALMGLAWQYAVPNAKFDIEIDDVTFIGACGEPFAQREEAAEAEPAPAPAPAPSAADIKPIEEVAPDTDTSADVDTSASEQAEVKEEKTK